MSGATIIAPMTVAVESPTMPAVAMMVASTSSVQKRVSLAPRWSPSNSSSPRMRSTF